LNQARRSAYRGVLRDHRRQRETLAALALVLVLVLGAASGLSCRTSTKPEDPPGLTLSLDAVPLLLKADSTSVATIWATVMEQGSPVADSTVVVFAASMGAITAEALTRDGLARATYRADQEEPGVASIVAQVRAVRDTVLVTVY